MVGFAPGFGSPADLNKFYVAPVAPNPPAVTTLTSGSTAAVSSVATASISPLPNALIIVSVASRDADAAAPATVPTVTGAGGTWVQIATISDGSAGARTVTLFRDLSASPGSGALTIDFAANSQGSIAWAVEQFINVDTSGTHGSGAIVQSGSLNPATGTTTGGLITLSAFGAANNIAYGYLRNSGAVAVSAGAGFLSLTNLITSGGVVVAEWESNDNTVDWSWASQSVTTVALAVEIKALVSIAAAPVWIANPDATVQPVLTAANSNRYVTALAATTQPVIVPFSPPTVPTPSAETDLHVFDDLPLRADIIGAALRATTAPVQPRAPPPPFVGCELGLVNGIDTLGLSTHNPTDTLAATCPAAAVTPSNEFDYALQEDLPRRRDYRTVLAATSQPVVPYAFRIAATPSIEADLTLQDDRQPARPDFRTALASTSQPVEVLNYQMAATPAAMANLVLPEPPRAKDYSRVLESTAHPVTPPQAPAPAQTPPFIFDLSRGEDLPRRPNYSRTLEQTTEPVLPIFIQIGTATPATSFFSGIQEDLPRRRDYRTVLADTTQPVVPHAFRTAITPTSEANLSQGEDLPRRRDYSRVLEQTTEPVLSVFVPVVAAPTPSTLFFPGIAEDLPRRRDYRGVLADTTQPTIPHAFRTAVTPSTGFDLTLQEDLPRRRDYRTLLASNSQPITAPFIPAPLVGCQLGLADGNSLLGLHNNFDVLGIPCLPNAVTPSILANLVVQEQRPTWKDYRSVLAPSSPLIPPIPPVVAQTPKFLFGVPISGELPRRKDYRLALLSVVTTKPNGPVVPFTGCELGLATFGDTLALSTHNPTDTLAATCPIATSTPSVMSNLVRYEDLPRRKDYRTTLLSGVVSVFFRPPVIAATPSRWFDPPASPTPWLVEKTYRTVLGTTSAVAMCPQSLAGVIPPLPPPPICTVTLTHGLGGLVTLVAGTAEPVVSFAAGTGTVISLAPVTADGAATLAPATDDGSVSFPVNPKCP